MKDELLLKICIFTAIFGIILLFFLTKSIKPEPVEIKDIDASMIGKYVEIIGRVTSVTTKNGHVFFTISNETEIKVVVFRNKAEKLGAYSIKRGDVLRISGIVSEYKGELEIIPKNIIFS